MVAANDFQDFTSGTSRLMLPVAQSPLVSTVAGWQSVVCDVPLWARSLNVLVAGNSNVISLSVTGVSTGFIYLNAMPAYDGGIYYIPAVPVIDVQVTVRWYQVTAASVSMYVLASDEPISVSVFNPVSPTQAISEHLAANLPKSLAFGGITATDIPLDSTTKAVRCTVDNADNYVSGKLVGNQSGKVYYDGTATNSTFPITPIPVDITVDNTVNAQLTFNAGQSVQFYAAAVNVPDFAGNIPLTHTMSSNELAPDTRQSETPNEYPSIFDGTVPASGNVTLIAAVAGLQLRLHAIAIMQYTTVATAIELQDTIPNAFFHYHYGAAMNSIPVPLFGQLAARGAGIRLHNTTAVLSGAVGVTLWYSVL